MEYFYCPPEKVSGTSLVIDGEEFSHLVHVMRRKEGDAIRVVDGRGNAYDVRMGAIRKREVECRIDGTFRGLHEPPVDVTLGVGVLKNPSKFDFLVEKTTELGVTSIAPLYTERTIGRHAKRDRWQKLALAAMKQCGRSVLPVIHEPASLESFVGQNTAELRLIAHESSSTPPWVMPPRDMSVKTIALLVGPEGGFSDEEVRSAGSHGFTEISFGGRRLRTETAAIVGIVLAMAEYAKKG